MPTLLPCLSKCSRHTTASKATQERASAHFKVLLNTGQVGKTSAVAVTGSVYACHDKLATKHSQQAIWEEIKRVLGQVKNETLGRDTYGVHNEAAIYAFYNLLPCVLGAEGSHSLTNRIGTLTLIPHWAENTCTWEGAADDRVS